jgi:DNA polymerase III epsilon subunit-like protein
VVEAAGLVSLSYGEEPTRAVEVRPRPGSTAPRAPEGLAAEGGEDRVAWIAIADCVSGKPADAPWHTLVNPGVPVDAASRRIHRLDDTRLGRAPAFERIADTVLSLLTPRPGETLVVVGHNVAFDLAVIRAELRRCGRELPDLPTLDTMGALAAHAGFRPGRALPDLCADLAVEGPRPWHAADQDAMAAARAACALLDLAADAGDYDMPSLLGALGGTTLTATAPRRFGRAVEPPREPLVLPPAHVRRHAVLMPGAEAAALAAWIAAAEECAELRCPGLAVGLDSTTARSVAALGPSGDPGPILDALATVAERRARRADGPGTATALDGIGLIYDMLCPVPLAAGRGSAVAPVAARKAPQKAKRERDLYPLGPITTVPLWHRLRVLLPALPRCSEGASCPRCGDGDPCPRDELVRRLAPGAWAWGWEDGRLAFIASIANFLPARGTGGWFTHRREGRNQGGPGSYAGQELADAALVWVLRAFRANGDGADPEKVVAWQAGRVEAAGGCADPGFWEMLALERSRPGRETDLIAAIALCDGVLAAQPAGTTSSSWAGLRQTRDLLDLRLGGVRRGHAIRHHPGPNARRPRRLRFA